MNRKITLLTLVLFLSVVSLFSQSNEVLDRFMSQDEADAATTIWLIYIASGRIGENSSPEEAFDIMRNAGYSNRISNMNGGSPIRFDDFSLILMDELELPGGLIYSIFKSPRYAAKEMADRRWMPGDPNPGSELKPWDVTTSISQVLAWKEAR